MLEKLKKKPAQSAVADDRNFQSKNNLKPTFMKNIFTERDV